MRSLLRHVRGPPLVKLLLAWLIAVTFSHRGGYIVDALHKRYVPVVRLAPHVLSFATVAAAREFYIGVKIDDFTDTAAAKTEVNADANGVGAVATSGVSGKRLRYHKAVLRLSADKHKSFTKQRPESERCLERESDMDANRGHSRHDHGASAGDEARSECTQRERDRRRLKHFPSLSSSISSARQLPGCATLPDLETVVRGRAALLLQAMVQRRGEDYDMLH